MPELRKYETTCNIYATSKKDYDIEVGKSKANIEKAGLIAEVSTSSIICSYGLSLYQGVVKGYRVVSSFKI